MMMDEKDWAEFKRKLKGKTEIDLDLYKEPQMKRRIGNLVTRAGMNSYTEYFDNAAKNKDDFAAFIHIGVHGDIAAGFEKEIHKSPLFLVFIDCVGFYPKPVERNQFALRGFPVNVIDVFH